MLTTNFRFIPPTVLKLIDGNQNMMYGWTGVALWQRPIWDHDAENWLIDYVVPSIPYEIWEWITSGLIMTTPQLCSQYWFRRISIYLSFSNRWFSCVTAQTTECNSLKSTQSVSNTYAALKEKIFAIWSILAMFWVILWQEFSRYVEIYF
jgi:hypothetical protein